MRRNALAVVLALCALGAACGQNDPGVGVQKIQADVVFGVKLDQVAPANFPTELPAIPDDALLKDFGPPVSKLRPPLAPALSPCPAAALNAFPATEAGFNVTTNPAQGKYRWKREGTQTLNSLPGFQLPVSGFETRYVRRVSRTASDITYQTVQTEMNTNQVVVTTWAVKTAPTQQTVSTVVGPTVRAGDPERGVIIRKIERLSSRGQVLGTFTPTPGILYLPLPVLPGESWTSSGVDALTGQTMQHNGTVRGRQRVDACGEVVDGWGVDGSETLAGGGQNVTRTYNYVMATQLGGLLVSEYIDGTTSAGTLKATFSLGQLNADPLPDDAK